MRLSITILFILNVFFVNAQSSNYESVLYESVNKFNHIDHEDQYQIALNQFIALTNAYPNEWLPYYYAAILQTKIALLQKGNTDKLADVALAWVNKCKQIQVNDEVLCAESFAYTVKMSVHPTWRFLAYQDRIKNPLQKAKILNPKNPRIYVLEANLQYHLPGSFGGGCHNAMPIAKQAEKLLILEKGKWRCLPTWGYTSIKEILTTCKY
jgi:hypothetical protein